MVASICRSSHTADIGAIERAIVQDGFERLPITTAHLAALAVLATHHRDPFDHLLMAQAIAEDAVLVSADPNAALDPARLLG
jgi:PIN domain nuclease of toxin-antitoxin system